MANTDLVDDDFDTAFIGRRPPQPELVAEA
jgi:hypothetical protein